MHRDVERRRTKPPPVRLYSPWLRLVLSLLERGSLYDPAVPVADGLAAAEHLETAHGFGIMIEVLSLDLLKLRLRC